MDRPRLIHYNDAHHFHAKRLEPPASRHLLNWPVDEVLGTGVDLLVLGLGYSDVFFHQSEVGRVVGQGKEVWENYIDWRIMRMVEVAKELGTDQVRAVVERGRETGLKVFPSLKLQDSARPGSERFGRLKEQHGAAVCIGDAGRAEWCYDYAQEAVQGYKLAIIGEVLEGYRADGLELDFCFDNFYFKKDEIQEKAPLMTEFVAKVRALAEEIGARQGRKIPLMARVHLHEEDNLAVGLDVEAWLRAGSLDWVVGQDANVLVDPGIQAPWLAEVAENAGAVAYYRPPRRIYDERVGLPSIEMYRALSQTLAWQGYAGMYLGYMPWPLGRARVPDPARGGLSAGTRSARQALLVTAARRGHWGRDFYAGAPSAGTALGGRDGRARYLGGRRCGERPSRRRDAPGYFDAALFLFLH